MNTPTEALPDSRISEEIGKLMTETVRLAHEQAKHNANAHDLHLDRWWYPPVAMGAAAGAGAAMFFILTKFFGV